MSVTSGLPSESQIENPFLEQHLSTQLENTTGITMMMSQTNTCTTNRKGCMCKCNIMVSTVVYCVAITVLCISPLLLVSSYTVSRTKVSSNLCSKYIDQHQKHWFSISVTSLAAESNEETSGNDNDSSRTTTTNSQWLGNDMYQRVLYRFSSGSDVAVENAIVIEERCRYKVDEQRTDYIVPTGPRTIILRNGQGMNFDEGEIGDDFFSINVAATHNGAGNDYDIQGAIVCAMYLASNPDLCQGNMMELSATTGFSSLLGCIGAGYVSRYNNKNTDDNTMKQSVALDEDILDDILTIGKDRNGLFPSKLDLLTITDTNEEELISLVNKIKSANPNNIIKSCGSKLTFDVLDWRIRPIRRPNTIRSSSSSSTEFRTVITSNIDFSYPETRELARTVANRLEPISQYIYKPDVPLPRFVHVCSESRDDNVIYLRRTFEKGYRMSVSSKFLKLEKYIFHLQKLPTGTSEIELDSMDLELKDIKEIQYQAVVGQHHPDYAGGGSGEMFFPIETGEYEATGGSSFLEKETGSSSSSW